MLVIGKNPILELLKTNPKEFNKIIVLKSVKLEQKVKNIKNLAEKNNIGIQFLDKYHFQNYFNRKNKDEGVAQGVVGFINDYNYSTLKKIVSDSNNVKNPLILILDEITDPQNMGAIIRSAVCFGSSGVVIPRHNSAEVNHTVIKASAGAVHHIAITKETNLINTIKYLKDNGFWIVGTDAQTKKYLHELDVNMPIGLVIGSEGFGIRKHVKDNCDFLVKIQMTGKIDSLNASVSAGITLYEIYKKKS